MIKFLISLFVFLDPSFFNVQALNKKDSSAFVNINDTNLESKINNTHQKWFIMFYEAWCPHCKKVFPTINEVAQRLNETVFFGMVDWYEKNQNDIKKYYIHLMEKAYKIRNIIKFVMKFLLYLSNCKQD